MVYAATLGVQHYGPVGACIYCGGTTSLQNEHIVPLALGGQWILDAASCGTCANITKKFEQDVLRGFMLRARTTGRFPTRRPKERPTRHTITLANGDDVWQEDVPVEDDPAILQLPVLTRASFLSGAPEMTGINIRGVEAIGFGKHPSEVAKAHGAATFRQTDNVNVKSLARMLAKIGYSYSVAVMGPPPSRNEILALPFILGQSDDGCRWVGSCDFSTPAERDGANLVLSLSVYKDHPPFEVQAVRIKLFAQSRATGYEVVLRHARRHDANA